MAPWAYLHATHLHWHLGLVAYMQFVLQRRDRDVMEGVDWLDVPMVLDRLLTEGGVAS